MHKSDQIITRFAPSPTGHLHLGHAYSAKLAYDFTKSRSGKFLLRIEDIDQGRCKDEFEQAIYQDLNWFGLDWERPVRRQSEHMTDYQAALDILQQKELLYPCFCTRKDIRREIEESGRAPHNLAEPRNLTEHSQEGPLYPGSCRNLSPDIQQEKITRNIPFALRLHMDKALTMAMAKNKLYWTDLTAGKQEATADMLKNTLGDVVLARKDISTSYHLSVVVDDHLQNISHIIRGMDLFHATHLHRLLQFLLNYKTPDYLHHKLLTDDKGWRYAKRDNAKTLRHLREEGHRPEDLIASFPT